MPAGREQRLCHHHLRQLFMAAAYPAPLEILASAGLSLPGLVSNHTRGSAGCHRHHSDDGLEITLERAGQLPDSFLNHALNRRHRPCVASETVFHRTCQCAPQPYCDPHVRTRNRECESLRNSIALSTAFEFCSIDGSSPPKLPLVNSRESSDCRRHRAADGHQV